MKTPNEHKSSMKQIVLFNNKGGVGKTTFIQHLGFALEKKGKRVLFVDADPQCNLTSSMCTADEIQKFWDSKNSIYATVQPLITGSGDIAEANPHKLTDKNLWILPGDLLLSEFEETLSENWVPVQAGREIGFRATSGIYRAIKKWGEANKIDYILIDVGPNLGSLNRAILLGCDFYIVPLIPDLFSLRGLTNIGTAFIKWIKIWSDSARRLQNKPFPIQEGKPVFAGYVLGQFNIYRQKETKAWKKWAELAPNVVRTDIVDKLTKIDPALVKQLNGGDYHIGDMKNYHSLIPMAQTALKPVFELTSKDGVIGTHAESVDKCRDEYDKIADTIIAKIG